MEEEEEMEKEKMEISNLEDEVEVSEWSQICARSDAETSNTKADAKVFRILQLLLPDPVRECVRFSSSSSFSPWSVSSLVGRPAAF